jgi:hypothetical protein
MAADSAANLGCVVELLKGRLDSTSDSRSSSWNCTSASRSGSEVATWRPGEAAQQST